MRIPKDLKPLFDSYLIEKKCVTLEEFQKLSELASTQKPLEEILLHNNYLHEEDLQLIIKELEHQAYEGKTQKIGPEDCIETPRTITYEKTTPNKILTQTNQGLSTINSFGNYEVLEKLAQGGMGIVYKVKQKENQNIYALKVILAGVGASPETINRFHREVKTTAKLKHPNIVQVIDSGEEEGQHYFCMEFVEGTTLENAIKKGLSIEEGLKIIQKTLIALDYAHKEGVIHRDLKPANIFITAQGEPKIGDFGLAKDLSQDSQSHQLTQSGEIIGTPAYMAPEQIKGKRGKIDETADIYSIGACLYQILTNRPPFEGSSFHELFFNIITEEAEAPSKYNPAVTHKIDTIVLTALDKFKQKRYQTAIAFAEDIERYLVGVPIYAKSISHRQRMMKWIHRHHQPLMLGTILGLLGGIFVLYYQWTNNWSNYQVKHKILTKKVEALTREKEKLKELNKKYEEELFYKISDAVGRPLKRSIELTIQQTKQQLAPKENAEGAKQNYFLVIAENLAGSEDPKNKKILDEICIALGQASSYAVRSPQTQQILITKRKDKRIKKVLFSLKQADIRKANGDLKGAIQHYTHAIQQVNQTKRSKKLPLKPQFAQIYTQRGELNCQTGNFQTAIKDCDKAISSFKWTIKKFHNPKKKPLISSENPNEKRQAVIHYKLNLAVAYNHRGFAKYQLKDFVGAIHDYSEAIRLHPQYPTLVKTAEILSMFLGGSNPQKSDLVPNLLLSLLQSLPPFVVATPSNSSPQKK